MTQESLHLAGRVGFIMRVLPHGTVMVWDPETKRAYPFYKAGYEVYHAMEEVRFQTDSTDTIVTALQRTGGSKDSKTLADYVTERKSAHA